MRHGSIWRTECVRRRKQYHVLPDQSLVYRNIAEQLIEKGLASVVRHRRDDEDRSVDLDKLIAAEQGYVHFSYSAVYSHNSTLLVLLPSLAVSIPTKSSQHISNL
jgi:hypothetical protein